MLIAWDERKPPTYKSYKLQKFHKYIERQKALIQGVNESSLKDEDKKELLRLMRAINP